MSALSVCVLTPNGRRQTVKCTPNTTVLQIIEEVCRKQGFKPEEYDIKHHNKILDTTAIFRFSGLPNNAQLELISAVKNRVESDILLAINLEDGTRLTDTFKASDTLLQVLQKVCPDVLGEDKNPVVIYTRREIYGDELDNCNLRSLGITGGRAMIRLINRDPELLKQQANVSAPLPSKPVEEKPYLRKFQPLEEPKSKDTGTVEVPSADEGTSGTATCDFKPQRNVKDTKVDVLKLAREKRKSTEEHKEQEEKKKNMGYSMLKSNNLLENMEKEACTKDTKEQANLKKRCMEEEFVFLGKRNAMLFSQQASSSIPTEDLPDEFFELTITDAKRILKDVRKMRYEMDNTPLKTSELRKLEESKKQLRQLNRYKKAIIRVQFPDRMVLQGIFSPVDTIKEVKEFVKEYLDDNKINFHLYVTPPKSVLDEDSKLIEIGCVPGALLHFGTNDENRDNILKKELKDQITSNSVASLAAAKFRHENARQTQDDDSDIDYLEYKDDAPGSSTGASTSTGITHDDANNYERKIVKTTENVPKWFKQ